MPCKASLLKSMPARVAVACALAIVATGWTVPANADLQDEIQVYTDDISKPGEFGIELHVNTTPSGRSVPDYPGEITPQHAFRVTPEFSYGLSRDWEAGLYVPTLRTPAGNYEVAGAKLRMKWLPVRAEEGQAGYFAGANVELSRLAKKFSESRWSTELRIMLGYRGEDWLLGVNPVFGWDLSDGLADGKPDVSFGLKLARDVAAGIALGFEYYAGLGKISENLPANAQDHRLFLAVDVDRKPWVFNLGIGRGLTTAADRWTVKLIAELPF
jgi:hypothetical protein